MNGTSIDAQYANASKDDLRILIVGAGIADITAAQMLRKAGRHPILIERNDDNSHRGRMIRVDSMSDILDRYGDYRGIARGELLEVLTTRGCDVAFGTMVSAIDDAGKQNVVLMRARCAVAARY